MDNFMIVALLVLTSFAAGMYADFLIQELIQYVSKEKDHD